MADNNQKIFNINKLQHLDDVKIRKLSYKYQRIYEMCIKDIKYSYKTGRFHCVFSPPLTISDEPKYDIGTALCFLIKKLRGGGFIVFYKMPYELIIMWGKINNYEHKLNEMTFLQNEIKNTNKLYDYISKKNITLLLNMNQESFDNLPQQITPPTLLALPPPPLQKQFPKLMRKN